MKCYMICILLLYATYKCCATMTDAQMKAAAKMVRNVCQPKAKVSDELIENTHKGIWVEDESLMCFYKCVLSTTRIAKNLEYLLDSALTQAATVPEYRQEATKKTIMECQNAGDGETNKCRYAYKVAKCYYDSNPENYFLP